MRTEEITHDSQMKMAFDQAKSKSKIRRTKTHMSNMELVFRHVPFGSVSIDKNWMTAEEILNDINNTYSGLAVKKSQVHPALHALEKEGSIRSRKRYNNNGRMTCLEYNSVYKTTRKGHKSGTIKANAKHTPTSLDKLPYKKQEVGPEVLDEAIDSIGRALEYLEKQKEVVSVLRAMYK